VKILIDTNIIFDAVLERSPHSTASAKILFFAKGKRLKGYISVSTISDLYYILRKDIGHLKAIAVLKRLVAICDVATVNQHIIEMALMSDFKDFEDAIQNCTAIAAGLDAIATRNPKDFAQSNLQILTPEQLIQMLS
jgi:predicted nucleic acid-binding protein